MGYRHIMMSETMVPATEVLPKWFLHKYDGIVDFSGEFWKTFTEYKRYGVMEDFPFDVQKVLKELEIEGVVRLVWFADESDTTDPDIEYTVVSSQVIIEGEMEVKELQYVSP